MKRAAVALSLALLVVAAAQWIGHAQPDAARFTGTTENMDAKDLGVSRRSFDPGARTAWHSHDKGQLIFAEKGRGRVQRKGEPWKELAAGDSDYTRPGVVHWHGAGPDQRYIQIVVGFGGETKWFEVVTDSEYSGRR
jgi:quercetin dioxygenase-like cupin family protein